MYYLLLDAAHSGLNLLKAKELNPSHSSLYEGKAMAHLVPVSPHLFTFNKNTEFADLYFNKEYGKNRGILFSSIASFDTLLAHFRKFLTIRTEYGKELYFRFYDPRVIRNIFPDYDHNKLTAFFRPIDTIYCEDENPENVILFSFKNGNLNSQKISKAQIFEEFGVKMETSEVKKPLEKQEPAAIKSLEEPKIEKPKKKSDSDRWGWLGKD